ncbi:response regulator [Lysobacter soli]|uniref:response regulator n=1 Tax=Lysobacter soli TaxID=453783 RepID=UPI003CE980E2
MRVLFVEDEADTRVLVAAGLEMHGFGVRLAEDGLAAIQALREDLFDLVVTDVSMPNGVSGIQVAEAAARLQPSARVLIVSGYAPGQLPELPHGTRYLAKPYRTTDLISTLRTMLEC